MNVSNRTGRNARRTRIGAVLAAVVVCAALAAATVTPVDAGTAGAIPATAADGAVLNTWNVIAQNQTIPLRPTAHGTTRGIAMVQGAVYDAVNAIDRRHQPYLLDVDALDIDPSASYGAAIATAAHHVLVAIVPAGQVGALDSAYATTLAGIPDGPAEDEGVTAGEAAAAAMLGPVTGSWLRSTSRP